MADANQEPLPRNEMATAGSPAPQRTRTRSPDPESLRFLTDEEWAQFCRGVGVFSDKDDGHTLIRPTCWYWPVKGFSDGLYRDILYEKTKFTYWFHILSTIQYALALLSAGARIPLADADASVSPASWFLMLVQIGIGACLTALGAFSREDGTAITIMAAFNTCVGGILALLHNSGLPGRYRYDRNEFYQAEEYIKAIIDTRLVPEDQDIKEVMAGCFHRFRAARQTGMALPLGEVSRRGRSLNRQGSPEQHPGRIHFGWHATETHKKQSI